MPGYHVVKHRGRGAAGRIAGHAGGNFAQQPQAVAVAVAGAEHQRGVDHHRRHARIAEHHPFRLVLGVEVGDAAAVPVVRGGLVAQLPAGNRTEGGDGAGVQQGGAGAGAGIQQAGGAVHVDLAHFRGPRRPVGRAPGEVAHRLHAAQCGGQRGGVAEVAGRQFDVGIEYGPRSFRVADQAAYPVAAPQQGVRQRGSDSGRWRRLPVPSGPSAGAAHRWAGSAPARSGQPDPPRSAAAMVVQRTVRGLRSNRPAVLGGLVDSAGRGGGARAALPNAARPPRAGPRAAARAVTRRGALVRRRADPLGDAGRATSRVGAGPPAGRAEQVHQPVPQRTATHHVAHHGAHFVEGQRHRVVRADVSWSGRRRPVPPPARRCRTGDPRK